ncbi:hypothetical protein AB0425_17850 [Actinosynnema sp. NPDC051121]
MTQPPPPPHEVDILRAIADGLGHAELLGIGRWAADEVAVTLARNELVVTPGGTIVRAGAPIPTLLQLAGTSPSSVVRKAAARADAALIALGRVLAQEHAGKAAESVRSEQRVALTEWLGLLASLTEEAQIELQRLTKPVRRTNKAAS